MIRKQNETLFCGKTRMFVLAHDGNSSSEFPLKSPYCKILANFTCNGLAPKRLITIITNIKCLIAAMLPGEGLILTICVFSKDYNPILHPNIYSMLICLVTLTPRDIHIYKYPCQFELILYGIFCECLLSAGQICRLSGHPTI